MGHVDVGGGECEVCKSICSLLPVMTSEVLRQTSGPVVYDDSCCIHVTPYLRTDVDNLQ